jgi:hypothetical protein
VKKFIENLDKDKAERDRKLDEQDAAKQKHPPAAGEARPHKPQKMGIEGTQKYYSPPHHPGPIANVLCRTVTDPTTGKEVVIEDVSKTMMNQVENPQLSVPNANLGKDTVRPKHR